MVCDFFSRMGRTDTSRITGGNRLGMSHDYNLLTTGLATLALSLMS